MSRSMSLIRMASDHLSTSVRTSDSVEVIASSMDATSSAAATPGVGSERGRNEREALGRSALHPQSAAASVTSRATPSKMPG